MQPGTVREDGDRLWRALLAFGGDPEVASDAVAEAFAQALRRGAAVSNPQAWVWRAGFRIAAGELKKRGTSSLIPDVGYLDAAVDQELLDALAQLPDRQRAAVVLFYYVDASVREIANRTGSSQTPCRTTGAPHGCSAQVAAQAPDDVSQPTAAIRPMVRGSGPRTLVWAVLVIAAGVVAITAVAWRLRLRRGGQPLG